MIEKKSCIFICSLRFSIIFFVLVDSVNRLSSVKSIFLLINNLDKIILIEIKAITLSTKLINIEFLYKLFLMLDIVVQHLRT